jgi:hypothetical protein
MLELVRGAFEQPGLINPAWLPFAACCGVCRFSVNHMDIAPKYAGMVMGISNTAGEPLDTWPYFPRPGSMCNKRACKLLHSGSVLRNDLSLHTAVACRHYCGYCWCICHRLHPRLEWGCIRTGRLVPGTWTGSCHLHLCHVGVQHLCTG